MFNGLLGKFGKRTKSKDVAKKRLQFALVYDKLEISEESFQQLQQDLVETVSRYFVIDKESLKLDIQKDDDLSALVLNMPIIRSVKHKAQA